MSHLVQKKLFMVHFLNHKLCKWYFYCLYFQVCIHHKQQRLSIIKKFKSLRIRDIQKHHKTQKTVHDIIIVNSYRLRGPIKLLLFVLTYLSLACTVIPNLNAFKSPVVFIIYLIRFVWIGIRLRNISWYCSVHIFCFRNMKRMTLPIFVFIDIFSNLIKLICVNLLSVNISPFVEWLYILHFAKIKSIDKKECNTQRI